MQATSSKFMQTVAEHYGSVAGGALTETSESYGGTFTRAGIGEFEFSPPSVAGADPTKGRLSVFAMVTGSELSYSLENDAGVIIVRTYVPSGNGPVPTDPEFISVVFDARKV